MDTSIRPFTITIDQAELDDLRQRLQMARLPEPAPVADWSQGVPMAEMRQLRDWWLERYDWRRCEARLNGLGQSLTTIDGVDVHFLHVRSPHPHAVPLVLTHGWPGSVVEFLDVVGPLVDPPADGGAAADAFHVVIPSLPGYGFSSAPRETGWNTERIARAWAELMRRLGYGRFFAQGGDWGASVTSWLARNFPDRVAGIHLNMVLALPDEAERAAPGAEGQARMEDLARHSRTGRGYSEQQSTRPQTLGYALADSPLGQAAWIFEKFREWSDAGDDPAARFGLDRLLDNIMLYWLPNRGASSARLYWESIASFNAGPIAVPTAVSVFKREIFRPLRRWVERQHPNLVHFRELDEGGHFAAFEVPNLFVEEVRAAFRTLRPSEGPAAA